MEPFAGNAHLPIDTVLPEIVSALRECPNLVLRAPTGAGKTTRVPLELWRSGLAGQGWVALVEPRRLAARAACSQMARQIGGQPGDLVGYMVRHEKRVSAASRVVAMTSGILLARLVADPTLEGIGAVVLDEFHERGIETDLILGMVRTIRETLRPDLKLVVMSATLDVSPLVAYLGDCRVVDSPGRLFPVTQLHEPMDRDTPLATAMARGVRRLLEETPGADCRRFCRRYSATTRRFTPGRAGSRPARRWPATGGAGHQCGGKLGDSRGRDRRGRLRHLAAIAP